MNLYEALCQINGKDRIYTTPSEITAAAVNAGADPIADETIQMFCKIFGSVAGSMALTVGALGGRPGAQSSPTSNSQGTTRGAAPKAVGCAGRASVNNTAVCTVCH